METTAEIAIIAKERIGRIALITIKVASLGKGKSLSPKAKKRTVGIRHMAIIMIRPFSVPNLKIEGIKKDRIINWMDSRVSAVNINSASSTFINRLKITEHKVVNRAQKITSTYLDSTMSRPVTGMVKAKRSQW